MERHSDAISRNMSPRMIRATSGTNTRGDSPGLRRSETELPGSEPESKSTGELSSATRGGAGIFGRGADGAFGRDGGRTFGSVEGRGCICAARSRVPGRASAVDAEGQSG